MSKSNGSDKMVYGQQGEDIDSAGNREKKGIVFRLSFYGTIAFLVTALVLGVGSMFQWVWVNVLQTPLCQL